MVDREGGPEDSRAEKNIEGDCQGVKVRFESPMGTNTPVVEEFPHGVKTSGVTLKGGGVPVAERKGQGGDGNSPASQDTKGNGNTSRGE